MPIYLSLLINRFRLAVDLPLPASRALPPHRRPAQAFGVIGTRILASRLIHLHSDALLPVFLSLFDPAPA